MINYDTRQQPTVGKTFIEKRTKYLQSFHKCLRSALGNRAQVVDQIGLRHANPGVNDGQGAIVLVGNNVNAKVLAAIKLRRIG